MGEHVNAKPLAWSEIRQNAARFAKEWAGESYEKGESQSFWTELFAVYGVRRRNVAKYEARAQRLGGGGYIDVFWPGMMIAEQKSLGRDLMQAEQQALEYLDRVADAERPAMWLPATSQLSGSRTWRPMQAKNQ